jgi:hypothetical protein
MNRDYAFRRAPRCAATSKRTGRRCQAPAERGKSVCRFHGARGGAPTGARNGAFRHGLRSRETTEEYQQLLELLRPRVEDLIKASNEETPD